MTSGPEQGATQETTLQRKIRETREYIRKALGKVDADAQKSDDDKKREKERMARTSHDDLKKKIADYEKIPESQRDHDKIEEDILTHVNELAELVKNKVVPHLPEITEAVVIALATKKFDKKKAILIGTIVGEVVDSPEFKAVASQGVDQVKTSLKNLAERLRRAGHADMAETIQSEVESSEPPKEPPKPPEKPPTDGTPNGAEYDQEGEKREDVERYLDMYYAKRTIKRDYRGQQAKDAEGNPIYESQRWLDVLQDQREFGGMSTDLQRSLLGRAISSQIPVTRSQNVLLRAFDGGEEFKAYFQARRHMMAVKEGVLPAGSFDLDPKASQRIIDEYIQAHPGSKIAKELEINKVYKEMSEEVKDLVRGLLSVLSGTVEKSNKEVQFISLLNDKIAQNVRREITGDTDIDIPGSIELVADAFVMSEDDVTSGKKGDEVLMGGAREYVDTRAVRVSLSEALVDDLTSTITKLQKVTIGFHNARDFAYAGGSHKDFAEGIKRDGVKPGDLNWTFKKEPDVNLAYNLFIQSLEQLKAQTGRTITERYGAMSKVGGLTEAEYRTWIQLLSLDQDYINARNTYESLSGRDDEQSRRILKDTKEAMQNLRQRKLRAVKMASGIAWGYSKEAWGILLDAKLLVSRKIDKDGEITMGNHYGGSQSAGIEKMVAELHPAMLDERWGRDKIAPIWMLYQPRDLEAAKGAWSRDEAYTHTRLYDLFDQHQKAFYTGRSDELADFDDKYVTVHEFANVTSLHMLRREGWRLRQYELYQQKYKKEAEAANKTGLDYHNFVIKRLMMRGGPRLVKMYIDGNITDMAEGEKNKREVGGLLYDIKRSKQATKREEERGTEPSGRQKALVKGREAETKLKERYYEKYIFEDISKRFTTSLIAFEQPRFIPKGERSMYTALNKFVEGQTAFGNLPPNILQTEIYPIFIDALHTVERNKWENYYRDKSVDEATRISRQIKDPADLTNADFEDPSMKEKLKVHYELNRERIGELTENKHALTASFDEYYKSLKLFYKELQSERDRKDRYDRESKRKGKPQSLSARYAHMLALNQGGINQALGGSYFDFSLEIQQGGVDAINRLGSDTIKSADMTEAWGELTKDGGALEKFAQAGAEDEEALKSGAKSIAEGINKICSYPYAFSPDQGNEWKIRHEIFWGRAFAKPDVYRGGLIGQAGELYSRILTGNQTGSLFAEYYKEVLGRSNVTSLDSDKLRTVLKVWEKELRVPMTKFEAAGYQNPSEMARPVRALRAAEDSLRHIPIIGAPLRGLMRTITSPITEARVKKYKIHKFYQGQAFKELGARKRDVAKENIFSVQSIGLFFAGIFSIFAGAKESLDKKK